MKLAKYMQRYNLFTFDYMDKDAEGNDVIVFTNWKSRNEDKSTIAAANKWRTLPYVGIATLRPGEMPETKEIGLIRKGMRPAGTEDARTGAVKSKPGSVLLYFMDKKEQRLVLWLDSMNNATK